VTDLSSGKILFSKKDTLVGPQNVIEGITQGEKDGRLYLLTVD
jgi:hypothetical protein